jgi:transposase-like protein
VGKRVEEKPARRYPREFRLMAVERMKSCDNIGALAQELGVPRRRLYKWRDRLDPVEPGEESALQQSSRESRLRTQVHRLKGVIFLNSTICYDCGLCSASFVFGSDQLFAVFAGAGTRSWRIWPSGNNSRC